MYIWRVLLHWTRAVCPIFFLIWEFMFNCGKPDSWDFSNKFWIETLLKNAIVAQMSGRAGGAIHEMKMKSIALDLFFCFSKGEKDLFQRIRFCFKKNHLKRISLKWKGFLHQMKRISTLKWKGFTFLKSRWNEMKRKLFLPTRFMGASYLALTPS